MVLRDPSSYFLALPGLSEFLSGRWAEDGRRLVTFLGSMPFWADFVVDEGRFAEPGRFVESFVPVTAFGSSVCLDGVFTLEDWSGGLFLALFCIFC